jgi:hypothetical protein
MEEWMSGMDLERLTALEQEWLDKQHGITEDRETQYEQAGVYAAWRDIFRRCVALVRKRDTEALKRALYLAWTQVSQDPQLSGVKDLDEKLIRKALGVANELAKANELDDELRWMLPYYYLVEPSYLDRFEDLDDLKRVSRENPFAYRQACLVCSFDHRGHMGRYWRSKQVILRRWP